MSLIFEMKILATQELCVVTHGEYINNDHDDTGVTK